jgi:glycosyltransferase involved in cell wall biosynthesis
MSQQPRVVILRGHLANPWDLRPWEDLAGSYDVTCLVARSNLYELSGLALRQRRVRMISDALPAGRLRHFGARTPVNRYLRLAQHLDGAAIVHSVELAPWFSFQAAELKARLGFKLVLTVWETLPFLETLRDPLTRRHRRAVISATDLFLAATDRARQSLLLEGVPSSRIEVSPPGIDLEAFHPHRIDAAAPHEHVILSPGRLVWEKGHQDVLRALAALRLGLVGASSGSVSAARVLVVGAGPEQHRLERLASELGISNSVNFRNVADYDEMPAVYHNASCVVLASLPIRRWEEQFGIVLVEAMAAGLPVIASTSGAIPEVLDGNAHHFAPGDWMSLARLLARFPLARAPDTRIAYPQELLNRYSREAAAARLTSAYEQVLTEN